MSRSQLSVINSLAFCLVSVTAGLKASPVPVIRSSSPSPCGGVTLPMDLSSASSPTADIALLPPCLIEIRVALIERLVDCNRQLKLNYPELQAIPNSAPLTPAQCALMARTNELLRDAFAAIIQGICLLDNNFELYFRHNQRRCIIGKDVMNISKLTEIRAKLLRHRQARAYQAIEGLLDDVDRYRLPIDLEQDAQTREAYWKLLRKLEERLNGLLADLCQDKTHDEMDDSIIGVALEFLQIIRSLPNAPSCSVLPGIVVDLSRSLTGPRPSIEDKCVMLERMLLIWIHFAFLAQKKVLAA